MRKVGRYMILITMVCFYHGKAIAGIDPARAAAVDLASELEERSLKAQNEMQLLQTTGHLWTKEEMDAVTDFQKEFNDYVSSFNNLIIYAAEIYGIYYDVSDLVRSISALNREIADHPENAFAVALSVRKNNIYMKVMKTGTNVALDIREVILSDNTKTTEAGRVLVLSRVRPKLQTLNREIRTLCKYIRYTSVEDLWREISGRHYTPTSRSDVVRRCHKDWMQKARTASSTSQK